MYEVTNDERSFLYLESLVMRCAIRGNDSLFTPFTSAFWLIVACSCYASVTDGRGKRAEESFEVGHRLIEVSKEMNEQRVLQSRT